MANPTKGTHNGFYPTRRLAHAAMWRMLRKAKRKNRQIEVSVHLCPSGYYLKGAASATPYSIGVVNI
jgi:hypothetical protein